MRLGSDQLRDKALLALEDAVQECRYRAPRRSFLLRFALAYLWSVSPRGDRGPFYSFWAAMAQEKSPWSFSVADHSLSVIYRELGLERPKDINMEMWRRWSKEEGHGGGRHSETGDRA
jgi:hypothetical protein